MSLLTIFFGADYLLAAQVDKHKDQDLQKKLEKFLKAKTKEAKSMLSEFSNQEIDQVLNNYKKDKLPEENRMLWLIEEGFQRKADKIAASRLIFLFVAVIALISLLILLVWANLREQKKLQSRL